MHWLLHGNLTTAASEALRRHGHQTHTAAELELAPHADDLEVLKAAQAKQWDIATSSAALAGAPFEHDFYFQRCIVYFQLEGGDVEQDDAIDRLFDRYRRLSPRRLYTLTAGRVKVRQLPGRP